MEKNYKHPIQNSIETKKEEKNIETKFNKNIILRIGLICMLCLPIWSSTQLTAATKTPISSGNALSFDGSNDYVLVPYSSTLGNFTEQTIEAWINPAQIGWKTVLGPTNMSWGLGFSDQNQIVLYHNYNSNYRSTGTYTVNGTWQHVAVVHSNITHTINFYINGVNVGTITGAANITNMGSNENLGIGGESVGPGGNYANGGNSTGGAMDEIRIWNVARTQAQIQASMNSTIDPTTTGLVAYYRFDQGTAGGTNTGLTTLTDLTSNANNGTLYNFALTGSSSNWVSGTIAAPVTANANLSALTTSTGTLSPTFSASTTSYSANIPYSTTSLTVTPTVADVTSTVQVRVNSGTYATVTSGSASSTLSLNVGANTIDVKVTAQDGTTVKTYTITVTRATPAGNALSFDGTNDYILVPYSSTLGNFTEQTIEAWINPAQIGWKTILGPTNMSWGLGFSDQNQIVLYHNYNSDYRSTGTYTVNGTWQHVAVVHSNITHTINFYINGVNVGTITGVENITNMGSGENLGIGGESVGPGGNYANGGNSTGGTMDEIRIWNVARTQAQIQAGMTGTVSPTTTGLVAYYQFNQGVAGGTNTGVTTLTDATSNGNNGTLYNFALTGSTSNWVTSTIAPAVSSNANLNSLTTTAGTISPTFLSSTTTYTSSVSNSTATITVTPTALDANATIQVRINSGSYSTVSSGSASSALSLNVGTNPIDIKVTAQDGTTIKTYTLTVTRAAAAGPGNALSFDGSNDYVLIPYSTSLSNFTEQTIEAWIKPDAINWKTIIGTTDENWGVAFNGDDNKMFYWHGYASGYKSSVPYVNNGTWQHIAVVVSNITHTINFYINGTNVGTLTGVANIYNMGVNENIGIGGESVGPGGNYSNGGNSAGGAIDEVRIWNTARTQAEIQANMNNTIDPASAGLVAYYRFDQGTAGGNNTGLTTLTDLTSNSNNGTLYNFALAGSTSNWITSTIGGNGITTSVKQTNNDNIQIYPNPTKGTINLENIGQGTVELYTITGQKLKTINNPGEKATINLTGSPAGNYILKISNQNNTVTKKVVLQ